MNMEPVLLEISAVGQEKSGLVCAAERTSTCTEKGTKLPLIITRLFKWFGL